MGSPFLYFELIRVLGTAIYIFFILANIVQQGLPTETACNFTLDGQPAGGFTHVPTPTNEFLYNSLVFSQRNLPNVDHQLSISTSDLDRRVWVNFDYAIYTFVSSSYFLQSTVLISVLLSGLTMHHHYCPHRLHHPRQYHPSHQL